MSVIRKLSGTRGESISEVMISGLIIALGLLLAASMIIAASNMVSKESKNWERYYFVKNSVEMQATASPIPAEGGSVSTGADNTLTFLSDGYSFDFKVKILTAVSGNTQLSILVKGSK
jgi:Tfp pilus assembly protein PilV